MDSQAWLWLEAGFWMGLGIGIFIALPQICAWGPCEKWWRGKDLAPKEKDHGKH